MTLPSGFVLVNAEEDDGPILPPGFVLESVAPRKNFRTPERIAAAEEVKKRAAGIGIMAGLSPEDELEIQRRPHMKGDANLLDEFQNETQKSFDTFGAKGKAGIETNFAPVGGIENVRTRVTPPTDKERLDFIRRARRMTPEQRKAAGITRQDLVDPDPKHFPRYQAELAQNMAEYEAGVREVQATAQESMEAGGKVDPNSPIAAAVGGFVGEMANPIYLMQPELAAGNVARAAGIAVTKRIGSAAAGRFAALLARTGANLPLDVAFGTLDLALQREEITPESLTTEAGASAAVRLVLGLRGNHGKGFRRAPAEAPGRRSQAPRVNLIEPLPVSEAARSYRAGINEALESAEQAMLRGRAGQEAARRAADVEQAGIEPMAQYEADRAWQQAQRPRALSPAPERRALPPASSGARVFHAGADGIESAVTLDPPALAAKLKVLGDDMFAAGQRGDVQLMERLRREIVETERLMSLNQRSGGAPRNAIEIVRRMSPDGRPVSSNDIVREITASTGMAPKAAVRQFRDMIESGAVVKTDGGFVVPNDGGSVSGEAPAFLLDDFGSSQSRPSAPQVQAPQADMRTGTDRRIAERRAAVARQYGLTEDHPAVQEIIGRDYDELTGVLNRDAYQRAVRDEAPPPFVSEIDIAGLGATNSRFGESHADAILAAAGRHMARTIGDAGAVFRKGGDEFVVHWTDQAAEARSAASLRQALDEAIVEVKSNGVPVATWQGVNHYYGSGPTIGEASRNLYAQKPSEGQPGYKSLPPGFAERVEAGTVRDGGLLAGRAGIRGSESAADPAAATDADQLAAAPSGAVGTPAVPSGFVLEGPDVLRQSAAREARVQRVLNGSEVEFSASTLRDTFGLTEEQAVATEAIADAMGLDKSRIFLAKGGAASGDALRQVAEGSWYYDNVSSSLDSWQAKGTPEQLFAHLKKTKGAMEEAETIGLAELLTGRKSVTREEIAAFVEANRIDVQDVTKGDKKSFDLYDERGNLIVSRGMQADAEFWRTENPNSDIRERSADTKYADYQTPGGENYRELLLTLPTKKAALTDAELARWRVDLSDGQVSKQVFTVAEYSPKGEFSGYIDGAYRSAGEAERARDAFVMKHVRNMDAPATYQAPHWSEKNVLAHVRMNERTLPDGRRVLFIDEIQSDWHQTGRKKGYFDPVAQVASNRAKMDAGRARADFAQRLRELADEGRAPGYLSPWNALSDPNADHALLDAARRFAAADDVPYVDISDGAVPDGPFKGDGWKKLALKRVLAYAADNGFDGIAWTTGEMQAARYDLRKQVKEILHHRNDDGTFDVWVTGHDGSNILNEDDIPIERVEALVGKDVASKIEAGEGAQQDGSAGYREWTSLTGDGLAIGGEGMRGFYDRELPNIANDVAKKFGQRVERVALFPGGADPSKPWEVFDAKTGEVVGRFASESEGFAWLGQHANADGLDLEINPALDNYTPEGVHFLATPESMREAIRENGLPLFQRRAGAAKAAVEFVDGGKAVIRALESPDLSSAVHELAHTARRFLFDRSIPAEARVGVSDADIATAEQWAGAKDGTWTRRAEEKFARGFERYMRDGVAPTIELESLFARFRAWLTEIYSRVTGTGINVRVSPEMRAVFDRLVMRGGNEGGMVPGAAGFTPADVLPMAPGSLAAERAALRTQFGSAIDPDAYVRENVAARERARETPAKGFAGFARSFLADAKTKLVDFAAPIEDVLHEAVKREGIKLMPSQDITNRIDRVLRTPSIAAQFMRDNGLDAVIREVPDLDKLDQYLIAKHAPENEAAGFATGRDALADEALVAALAPEYEQFAQRVYGYSNALLDYAVDSGLIIPELAAKLREVYPNYVPMKRVFNALEVSGKMFSSSKAVASMSRQTFMQRLRGSIREIESPIESLLAKTNDAIRQGERNQAARLLAAYQDLPGNPFEIREVTAEEAAREHTFSFFDNGKKRTFATTREIATAAKAMDVQQLGVLGRILAYPVRIARAGITGLNIPFVLSNIGRDQITAAIFTRDALRTTIANPVNFGKAAFEALGHGRVYDDMLREGALFTSFDMSRDLTQTVGRIRSERSGASRVAYVAKHPTELLRTFEDLLARSEEFTRIQQYMGMLEHYKAQGLPLPEAKIAAARAARETTVNFARRGEWGSVINSAFLYLNAGIQGSRTLLRNVNERPAAVGAKLAATVFLPVMTAAAWNLADERRRKIYQDIAEWEKDNNIILILDGAKLDEQGRWEVIRIPLPPGISRLSLIPRRAVEQYFRVNEIAATDFAKSLFGAVTPIGSSGELVSAAVPQAFRPTLETVINRDLFTGRDVVPPRLQKKPTSEQVFEHTSGTARLVGDALDVSPIKVEHFVRKTGGGVGSQLLHYADQAAAAAGVIPQDQIGGEGVWDSVTRRFGRAYRETQPRKPGAAPGRWKHHDASSLGRATEDAMRRAGGKREVAMQLLASMTPVYRKPDGSTVEIPAGLARSFATSLDAENNVISRWVDGMVKQKKLPAGGSIEYV